MLKLFSCAVVLHYNHKHNEAIPQSQGFQSAHNSSSYWKRANFYRCEYLNR